MNNLITNHLLTLFLVVLSMPFAVYAEAYEQASANVYVDILKSAYKDVHFQLAESEGDIFAVIDDTQILLQPKGICPKISPDAKEEPPLCSMFAFRYPVGNIGRYSAKGFDPGRVRNQDLLKKLYGSNAKEVRSNCVIVNFLGKKLLFNDKQGAAKALTRVSARLEQILAAKPEIKEYIFPLAGTFYWRTIKNSHRLSAHSFAIAIDLNVDKGIYWLWNPQPTPEKIASIRKNYPQAIVDAFEAEGFIWGGKWHSFDLMHFEYRPEMIIYQDNK